MSVERRSPVLEALHLKTTDDTKFAAFRRVLRRIRESGPRYTFFLILNHCIPKHIFNFIKMSVREVRLADVQGQCPDSPAIRWATSRDWPLLRRAGYEESTLSRRFASSCLAVIYEENGEIIGASWYAPLAMTQWEEYQVQLELPQTGIWNFDLWVVPAHRGRRIAGKMLGFANAALYAQGYRYVYGVIVDMNRNSLRANSKAGSREIGRFLFMRILNLAYFQTAGSRYFGRYVEERKFSVSLSIPIGAGE